MAYVDLIDFDEKLNVKEVPFDQVNFYVSDGDVVADFDGTTALVENSARLFGNTFGIPYKFVNELNSINVSTLANVFNDLRDSIGGKEFLWGISEESLATCGPAKKPHVPFTHVGDLLSNKGFHLDGVLGEFGNGEITAFHENNKWVEAREGDILNSGVKISMSPLMNNNPVVSPYSLRKICDNGMTRDEKDGPIRVIGRGVDEVMQQIDSLADEVFSKAESLNHSFANLTAHRIDVFRAIRNMASAHQIPQKLREDMFERAGQLGPNQQTMYDAINIFTEVSRDIEDLDRRGRMQALAGTIVSEEELRCDSCGSHLG